MAPTNAPLPNTPGPFPVGIPVDASTTSLWDRISNWASENKGVVYTVAGLTLVVGAGGAVYYLSSSDSKSDGSSTDTAANKRKRQRDRKRAKERGEKDAAATKEKSADTFAGMSTMADFQAGTGN